MFNLDEKLMAFERVPCYTEGKHRFISEEFLQFPRGTRRHKVMQWLADEYRRELSAKQSFAGDRRKQVIK